MSSGKRRARDLFAPPDSGFGADAYFDPSIVTWDQWCREISPFLPDALWERIATDISPEHRIPGPPYEDNSAGWMRRQYDSLPSRQAVINNMRWDVVNAIRYRYNTGRDWNELPPGYPPRGRVSEYHRGFEELHALNEVLYGLPSFAIAPPRADFAAAEPAVAAESADETRPPGYGTLPEYRHAYGGEQSSPEDGFVPEPLPPEPPASLGQRSNGGVQRSFSAVTRSALGVLEQLVPGRSRRERDENVPPPPGHVTSSSARARSLRDGVPFVPPPPGHVTSSSARARSLRDGVPFVPPVDDRVLERRCATELGRRSVQLQRRQEEDEQGFDGYGRPDRRGWGH
jgi:hypothetical protein